jgi:hypothetical protein
MQVSMHTHKDLDPTVRAAFNHTTDWNPWLAITVTPRTSTPLNIPDEVTIHLDGMSIEEGYAFSDSWDEVGHAIREWVNYRTSVDNEGMGE